MRRLIHVVFLASIALVSCETGALAADAASAISANPGVADARTDLQRAIALIKSGNPAAADQLLTSVLTNPVFSQLTPQEQHSAYYFLAVAEIKLGDWASALPNLQVATLSPLAGIDDWKLRLDASYATGNWNDSVISFTHIAQNWPQALKDCPDQIVSQLADRASDISDDATIAFFESLRAAKWHFKDEFRSVDGFWFELARSYLDRGNIPAAAALMNEVSDVRVIIRARSDKRFDPVVALNPSHFDVDAAIAGNLADSKARAAAAPGKLEGINQIADLLVTANRAAEAIELLDSAIAKATPPAGSESPFSDYGTQINWTLNARATALIAMGRYREGLDALASGAARPEDGSVNVSQAINYAGALNEQEEPADALKAVAGVDDAHTSPFGRMALAHVKACAYAQLKDSANLDIQLTYLKAHVADNRNAVMWTLVCANDLDGAAKMLMEDLQNPLTRAAALVRVQDYLHSAGETADDKEQRKRLDTIRDRADVAAEISAVGRIAAWPVI